VGARRAVANRLGHRIRLRPHDVRAKPPAVRLEGEGHPPRDPDEVLRLQPRGHARRQRSSRIAPLAARHLVGAARREGIAEDQPQRSVVAKRSMHLAKDADQVLYIQSGLGLEPEAAAPGAAAPAEAPALEARPALPCVGAQPALRAGAIGGEQVRAPAALARAPGVAAAGLASPDSGRHPVIAKAPVRRAGHARLSEAPGEAGQDLERVAVHEAPARARLPNPGGHASPSATASPRRWIAILVGRGSWARSSAPASSIARSRGS
jgi:hypothetical protein